MKVVNFLGRGPSLRLHDTLSDSDFVVLANDFDREISQIPSFKEYLEKQTIHQVLNMVIGAADGYNSIGCFQNFDVVKLVRPYLNGIRVPGSSGQNIPLQETFLGDNHKPFMFKDGAKYPYDYAGTGVAAFAYTMLDCEADEVNVIGLDFYDNLNYGESNYLVPGKEGRDFIKDFWGAEDMQINVCNLVKGRPDTIVNLHTICKNFISGMEEIENLNIIKY